MEHLLVIIFIIIFSGSVSYVYVNAFFDKNNDQPKYKKRLIEAKSNDGEMDIYFNLCIPYDENEEIYIKYHLWQITRKRGWKLTIK